MKNQSNQNYRFSLIEVKYTNIYRIFEIGTIIFSEMKPYFKKSYILFPIYYHVCVVNVIMILHNRPRITFERHHLENMLEHWFPFEILIMLFSRIFEVFARLNV